MFAIEMAESYLVVLGIFCFMLHIITSNAWKLNSYYALNFSFEMYLSLKFTPRSLQVEVNIFNTLNSALLLTCLLQFYMHVFFIFCIFSRRWICLIYHLSKWLRKCKRYSAQILLLWAVLASVLLLVVKYLCTNICYSLVKYFCTNNITPLLILPFPDWLKWSVSGTCSNKFWKIAGP